MLSKLIFKLGAKKRNPTLFTQYEELKKTESYSKEQLEELQLERLGELLDIAYNKTEYYKKAFDSVGVKPSDIKTLEDIKRLPILEKKDIVEQCSCLRNYEFQNAKIARTSGSTCEPVVLYRNEEWESSTRAAQLRGYSWYGVKPWERNGYANGYLLGFKRHKTRLTDALVNRFRLFSYDKNKLRAFVKKLKHADYFEGYSSMIYEVAKYINKNGLGPVKLKMVKGTADKIYDVYQEEAQKAFGSKIVSEYGSTETGIIAFECPHGNMHIAMENVILERDEEGCAIVTNLMSHSMPIIRYRLNDAIELSDEDNCPCGMKHPIVADVLGRIGYVIYGKEKTYPNIALNRSYMLYFVRTGEAFNYQGVQTEVGKLQVICDRELSDELKQKFLEASSEYFGGDVEVSITTGEFILTSKGKRQGFVSKV